ncbi:MAG: FAD-dependent oxidoreductase [Ignavibacteriae bacterium]|nr:FAD-dependent oxidoreductase [Ignavibacteria bacterium]MBI3365616.1 FAD-dependent oxidoreductase [Ignavibacteriota bacterium]
MKKRRILVVGGLAAGPSAAAKAVRINPKVEVTLFEAAETVSYGICEAPYAIAGIIQEERTLVAYTPEQLHEKKGINVKILHYVEKIVPSQHKLLVRNLRNHSVDEYEYDKLILATGSKPRCLNLENENARNVFHLSSREDTLNILNFIRIEKPTKAVIIGGGYIGMEISEALRTRAMEVTIIHRHRLPMAGLELDTRERIAEELEKNQVQFVTNAAVQGLVTGNGGKVQHVVTNRGTFEADLIILSLGVEPNAAVARDAKIRTGSFGGILTDERQQTNVDDIYAAGDCCEVKNIVTGKPMYLPLATIASRAAWVAGENAAGGRATFKGAIRAIAVKIFGLEVAQVGLSTEEAKSAKFSVVTEVVTAYAKVSIMPNAQKVTVKLILDQRSNRLLGANVYGGDGAVLRANTLGVAIQQKLTIDDIVRLDLIYSPPFAPLWDPILVAANQAQKKLDRS